MFVMTFLQLNSRYFQVNAGRIQGGGGQDMSDKAQVKARQQIALEQPERTDIEKPA